MRHVLLHGHIFKNAGTTLDWSLQQSFGEAFLDHREDRLMRLQGRDHLEQLLAQNPGLAAVSSHHMTGDLPAIDGVNLVSVNLLRHPLLRIRSVYDFERKQKGDTPGAKAAAAMGFKDYVAWRMQPDVARTIRNYQTLYLAGCHQSVDNADIADRYFGQVLERLQAGALIGVVERYDESMVVLESELRPLFPSIDLSYVAQNVSSRRNPGEEDGDLAAATLAELGDLALLVIDENSCDLALYQLGRRQLQARIEAIEDFPARLADFRGRLKQKSGGFLSRFT